MGRDIRRGSTVPGGAVGFGCAGLYGLPAKRDRRAMLDVAYALGIRHFDVAPMYGLGLAEGELGAFLRSHPDVTVATKFGIRPTPAGAVAGVVQPPIRRLLQESSAMTSKVRQSGRNGDTGVVGRLLYTRRDYAVERTRRSLQTSLRALRTDHIHYFLLHEPRGAYDREPEDLVDFLDAEQRKGTIGTWGPAGDLANPEEPLAKLLARAPFVQHRYDFIAGHQGPGPSADRGCTTFGILGAALARARQALDADPQLRQQCSELLDADLGDTATLVALLVRDALRNNSDGTVLLSSTRPANLRTALAAPGAVLRNETDVIDAIAARCRGSRVAR